MRFRAPCSHPSDVSAQLCPSSRNRRRQLVESSLPNLPPGPRHRGEKLKEIRGDDDPVATIAGNILRAEYVAEIADLPDVDHRARTERELLLRDAHQDRKSVV